MGGKRKALSKKIRFEVLKRDKFTCQYCGKSAPDVVLEIDHIKPISKGGNNDIMNLITSCKDCNRGKSNIELSDDSVVKKQQVQLQEIAERKEQLEMMLEWRESLNSLEDDYIDAVVSIFEENTEWGVSEHGRKKIKKWIKEFSLSEVMDATETAIETYYDGSEESWIEAFNKISGICYVRRNQRDNPQMYYVNYTYKSLANKGFYVDKVKIKIYIQENVLNSEDFETLKEIIKCSRNWTDFKEKCEEHIGGKFIARW